MTPVLLVFCVIAVILCHAVQTSTSPISEVLSTSTPADDAFGHGIIDANDFVDHALENMKSDPKVLEKITPVEVGTLEHGGLRLDDVKLRGLESMYRSDNCTLRFSDTSFDIVVHLGARDLVVEAAWSKKVINIPFSGHLSARVADFSILMDVNIGRSGTATLQRLEVVRLSDIEVTEATGVSVVFNWALRHLFNRVVHDNRDNIVHLIETKGATAINEGIKGLGGHFNAQLNELRRRRR
ncbi:uncharacterized protein LOC135372230 [Ornithodoros turicata]|uniref:uncharacterized protein LOC135372230 n=1 Tax=Ornithodoros turicata TaxID=34597 RepID=UPI00313A2AD0